MAKRQSAKGGRKMSGSECPPWVLNLTPEERERLKVLVPIAKDKDTCEARPNVKRLRTGPGNGLWLVGSVDKNTKP